VAVAAGYGDCDTPVHVVGGAAVAVGAGVALLCYSVCVNAAVGTCASFLNHYRHGGAVKYRDGLVASV
jgi:hypothetical protein